MPGEGSTPVVTDKNRPLFTEYVQHADQVANEMEKRIDFDIIGLVGLAISAQVGGDDAVASLAQRGELVPPGIPQLRETVAEEHEGASPLLSDVHAQAIGFDKLV